MQPTFFINHGGGPCFFLDPGPMRDTWRELEDYLRGFMATLDERPRAILIVSGHWEADAPTVNAGAHPALIYDYSGFPAHTYRLTFPARGAPDVAARVNALLSAAGIASASETSRGWDHGVFVPLKVMLPGADVPAVQLSLQRGLDPATHLAIGRALKPLRDDGVLILGSGQSYHNMRGFFAGGGPDLKAEAFDEWLRAAMIDGQNRDSALLRWEDAPGARDAQPQEDHFLPLMVAAGAAYGEPGTVDFHGHALGKPISGFRFG
ncbi:dioxygenase [Sphingosinicellaceae bacterium]|nr:dioxygenase [Sphingosinicellaceae bacterium]